MDQRIKKHPLEFWEIDEKPTPQALRKYYADKYYQEGKASYELEYATDELKYFRAKLEQRTKELQHYLPVLAGGGELPDVGCGEGYTLAFFREQGWLVKGLNFSSAGVEPKNPSCADVLEIGDIFELLQTEIAAGNACDVIWLQNILEHVIDPLDLLRSLHTLISPGGMAVVTVPNDCSITQRGSLAHHHIDSPFWVAPPDHLSYFSHSSLTNVANATGWDPVEILADFPVDWFLFNASSNYVRDISVGKAAHEARVQLENIIHEQPIEDELRFWSATAKLGLGRNITAYLRPKD